MDYISVSAELERLDVDWNQASDTELKVLCPFHDDSTPSLYVNTEKKVCHCKSCSWSGDFISYLAKVEGRLRAETQWDLQKRYGIINEKTINPARVMQACKQIWTNNVFLEELKKRGVGPEEVKEYKLGVDRNRITIPIYDDGGFLVNIRKYLPGAPSDIKFRDEAGCGKKIRLYPIQQLVFDKIIICSGEIKAISAAARLNKFSIGAISCTGGENRWDHKFSEQFENKRVWVCYDVDETGVRESKRLATQLSSSCGWLGILELPLNKKEYPHGGIDDYKDDLIRLLNATPEFVIENQAEKYSDEPPIHFDSLAKVVHSNNVGTRVSVDCVVSAIDTMPYAIPKKVNVVCQKNIDWCKACEMHPIKEDEMQVTIPPEHPAVLGMIEVGEQKLREQLKSACGIPALCKVCAFETIEYQHAEDSRISENLDVAKRADDKSMLPAVIIADGINMNEPYTVTGRLLPDPKSNRSVLLLSEATKKVDSLSTFTEEDAVGLELFRPDEWTKDSIGLKLDHIYTDLENNVTQIYKRRQMHLMVDLGYHSPLFITFAKKQIKGWVEILIVGDSSQGKTETALNLQKHYCLGSWLSCKGASVAGTLGGLQQMSGRWFLSWGAMPTQDRRLLVLEELKGLHVDDIAKLTDARSSGIAEIIKIEKRKTFCRVRLVALSNPRSERPVSAHNSGVEVISDLIGSLEDVRRFDAFYIVNKNDLNISDVIGTKKEVEHVYTSDLSRRLVMWAWTVRNTEYEDEDHLLQMSIQMGNKYSDDVPIFDRGGGRYKIARLAAALACRTFSHEKPGTVLVRKCHVEYIVEFLQKVYDSESFGYGEYSKTRKAVELLVDQENILREIKLVSHPRAFAEQMLSQNAITEKYIGDILAYENIQARTILSFLLRSHCLRKAQGQNISYYKTGSFIRFLKDALEGNTLEDRPLYLQTSDTEM